MNHTSIAFLLALYGSAGLLHAQTYRLDRPDAVWDLPPTLREVSGLTFSPGDSFLLAVQDERGTVYALDPTSGAVVRELPITGKGDFEGLTVAGEAVILLRSDGRIFRWTWNGPLPLADTTGTDLGFPAGSDLEGLTVYPANGNLMVAAKDEPNLPVDATKGWYVHDAASGQRLAGSFGLGRPEFRQMVMALPGGAERRKLLDWLDKSPEAFPLGPSGIAVHPHSYDIYLLSSRGKVLLVLGSDPQRLHPLDPGLFRQPEGIAFNRRGDLFIATEGSKKEPARILVFRQP